MSESETEIKHPQVFSGEDRTHQASKKLCHPQEGEEIVITGMAGRFPNSDDVYHFRDNLFNKVDLVSGDFRRWKPIHPEVPQRTGKINDISSFDAGFFGVHHLQSHYMDPLVRMVQERTFEAILDAGYHPSELIGTKTAVFIGSCFSETEKATLYLNQIKNSHAITGVTRSMLAHYVSYFFGLQGPSCITDTACSSSMYAIEHGYKYIREGLCDMAIIAGACLCLHPIVSLQFARLGVLSADGMCKVFDNSADGYARSETISVIILQKAKDARRIYAHIVHSKLNSDGYKQQGITFPSSEMQRVLMKEVYDECDMDVEDVTFVEAHGTGTNVGDPEELNSLVDVFLPNRERTLHIGAVKSNTGHNEPAAGITSVVKVLIGMESGYIPPNLNFSKPRESIEALVKGRLKVVTEKMPWPDKNGIVGINCFGFGGSNGHLILRWNEKSKINGGLPSDDLPRLVCASGRTQQAITTIWNDLGERSLDAEFIKLLHTVFSKKICNHLFRGYQILSKTGEVKRSIGEVSESKPELVWVFNNFSSTWPAVGGQLVSVPLFSEFLEKIQVVVGKGINVILADLLRTFERENPLNQILGTVTVQICLVELLKALEIEPDLVVGLGTGELTAAYYEGQLSLDEVIFASLFCGFAFCKEKDKTISDGSFVFQELLNNLKNAIPTPLALFKKWLPLKKLDGFKQGSPEYFARTITSPDVFASVRQFISKDAVILVLGEKPEDSKATCLVEESSENPVVDLLNNLGCLYEYGYDMRLEAMYPKIAWPVSRGTPMISPLIKWKTNQNWFVGLYRNEHEITSGQRVVHIILKESWNFVTGHVVDGRNLFPATGYLTLAWETLAMITGKLMSDMRVIFENVKFLRAVNLNSNENAEMIVNIFTGEKKFEITEGGSVIVTGSIYQAESTEDIIEFSDREISKENDTLQPADIYKELKIRGYNYRGAFKGLKECSIDATKGLINWTGNWITFMDNMMQMLILQKDTKNLYIPTSIKRVMIDGPKHIELCSKLREKETTVPIFANFDLDMIKSGAIEFRGMKASCIPRRRKGVPVLETYKFIPNVTTLPIVQGIRVLIQVILENTPAIKVKNVEIPGDSDLLSPLINQALGDLPLIQAETIVLTAENLELPNIKVDDKKLNTQTNALLVVIPNAFGDDEMLDDALFAVKDTNGYVIAREKIGFDVSTIKRENLDVLCVCTTEQDCLILLRKSTKYQKPTVVDVSSDFDWISAVQETLKEDQQLILHSQNVHSSGILGLANCLRRETNGACVSCFYIVDDDDVPKFDPDHPFYARQVQKKLAINVWKNGTWGTYRHLLLEDNPITQCEHCYANVTVRGDLSSMKYIEGYYHNDYKPECGNIFVYVYYAALNFRDVMTATGRIAVDTITTDRALQECVQGFEFTGRDSTGKRVMGIAQSGALSTHTVADSRLIWHIPDEWSMEEAASIPVAYSTVIYAFLMRTRLKRGQSILIHSATGGVGQAAINIALYYNCEIFVTVGTEEKREYLRKNYPQIKEEHVGNSRDISFEQMIHVETKGRGVDFVLNSLAEEKLLASVRCLARNGHFLEIGKFDIDSDNELVTALFEKGATFHGIMLDSMFLGRADVKHALSLMVTELVQNGAVKPLPRTVFRKEEVIDAFKLMTAGKHMGKVIVRMREEEQEKICPVAREIFEGQPRYYCDPNGTYIIVGGLGGFGLQLADWLVMRRTRKLILTSRTGVKTGFQAMMMRLWQSYGVEVVVRTDDVTTKEGCIDLIKFANTLGPMRGIFNLAVVLKDALFENQSAENFEISFAPKAIATQYLDAITRDMCPELGLFVVFSSVSCGRGNPGQTNYAMANSIMERICERRKAEGYPALAIQWGAIGDVGLVAEMKGNDSELAIGGTLQQRISSCLQVLDVFLKQDEVIVGSMVVAEKSAFSGANNIIDAVLNILGIPDLKKISLHMTFPELGMDSMMGVEVKQTLEREYEVFLSAQDIRTMTFARLQNITKGKLVSQESTEPSIEEEQLTEDIKVLLYHIADEKSSYEPFIEIGDYTQKNGLSKIYILPGLEGTSTTIAPLVKNMKTNVVCLQYCPNVNLNTIKDWAKYFLPYIDAKAKSFTLVAHSYGCVLAVEMAHLLETEGLVGKLVFIDGSPEFMKKMLKYHFDVSTSDAFETDVVCMYMSRYLPSHVILKHKQEMLRCSSLEDRIKYGLSISPDLNMSSKYLTDISMQAYARMKATIDYAPNYPKMRSKAKLIKPKMKIAEDVHDYGLSAFFQDAVDVATFEGDHLSILKNPEVAQAIRKFVANEHNDIDKSQSINETTPPITGDVTQK